MIVVVKRAKSHLCCSIQPQIAQLDFRQLRSIMLPHFLQKLPTLSDLFVALSFRIRIRIIHQRRDQIQDDLGHDFLLAFLRPEDHGAPMISTGTTFVGTIFSESLDDYRSIIARDGLGPLALPRLIAWGVSSFVGVSLIRVLDE